MWRWLRVPVALVAILFVIVLAGTIWLLSGQRYQTLLTEYLSQLLDAEVQVTSSRLSLAGGLGVELAGLTIHMPGASAPVLTAEQGALFLDPKELLHGRLLFNYIRVLRPRMRLTASPEQGLAHLFGLLATTEKTVTGHPETRGWLTPTLAVRHVAIYDGGVDYERKSRDESFHLSQLQLIVSHPYETGVALSGSAVLGIKGDVGKITIQATAPTWSTQADQRLVAWQGSVHLQEVVVHQLGRILGQEWPSGTFSGELRYEGKSVGPIQVAGTVDARNVHLGPLSLPKVTGSIAQLQWNGNETQKPPSTWRERLRGVTGELQISQAQGGPKDDPRQFLFSQGNIALRDETLVVRKLSGAYGKKSHLHVDELTLAAVTSSPMGEFSTLLGMEVDVQEDGTDIMAMLSKLGVAQVPSFASSPRGKAIITASVYSPQFPTALAVDSEVRLQNVAVRLPFGNAEVTDGNGKFHLTNRVLETVGTEPFSFRIGESALQVTGQVLDYMSPQRATDVRISGDVALAELPEFAHGVARLQSSTLQKEVEALDQLVKNPAGRARIQMAVQTSVPSHALTYEGTVTLQQASVTLPSANLQLHSIDGSVQVTPQLLSTEKVTFVIAGASGQLAGTLRGYQTAQRSGEGQITFTGLSDEVIAPLLPLHLLVTPEGRFDGTVEVQLPQGGEMRTRGEIAIDNALLDPLPHVFHPFRITQGQLAWSEQGVTLSIAQGLSPGGAFTGSGQVHSLSPLNLELALNFPTLDLGAAFNIEKPKVEDPHPKNDTVQVRAIIRTDRLQYKSFVAEQVNASCYWHGRQADIHVEEAKTVGGTLRGDATLWPDHNGLYIVPEIAGADVTQLLAMLNTPSDKITGTLDGKGRLYFPHWQTWSNLATARAQVSLTLMDGVTQQIPVLVRLWSAVSLQGLLSFQLPSLPNEGLAFSTLTGDFALGDGRAVTSNLKLESSSVRLETAGEIDLAHHTLDLKTSLMPLHGITSSVAKVPLAGQLLARGAEMLTTLPFRVQGPYDDPTVTPLVVDLGQK